MTEQLLPESRAGGKIEGPHWVEPRAVQEIPADTVIERPLDSGLFVHEVRTPEEEASLDGAYQALEDPEEQS